MALLDRGGERRPDPWQRLSATAASAGWHAGGEGMPERALISVSAWQSAPCVATRARLVRAGRLGLVLPSDAEPEALPEAWADCPVLEVEFAMPGDGRGFSLARLLRERHGYRGVLRAAGECRIDQLAHLAACGFDAFVIPDPVDDALARRLLAAQPVYQAFADQPCARFRRRLGSPGAA